MNRRSSAILCAASPLAAMLPAQTAPPPPPPPAPAPGAADQPPRRVPEGPYKETIPPSPGDLSVWPRGVAPAVVGKALAEHFLTGTQAERFSGYPYVCTFYGAMTFAELTHDDAMRDRLIA